MRAFRLNVEQAELFFTICQELKADTEEKRIQIMEALAQCGQVEGVTETSMDKDAYVKHIAKQFGTVLRVSSKQSEDLKGDTNNGESTKSIGFNTNTFYSGGSNPGNPHGE